MKNFILVTDESTEVPKSSQVLAADSILSTKTLKAVLDETDSEYVLLLLKPEEVTFGRFSLNRFYEVAELTGAGLLYSDFYREENNNLFSHPLIDYQPGSIRDDFDFGEVVVIKRSALEQYFIRQRT